MEPFTATEMLTMQMTFRRTGALPVEDIRRLLVLADRGMTHPNNRQRDVTIVGPEAK